jgi:hypothetical protein
MKVKLISWILLALILILSIFYLFSCKPIRYLDKHHTELCNKCIDEYAKNFPKKDTVNVVIDTVYVLGAGIIKDEYQNLYFKCDSSGNVKLMIIGIITDSLSFVKGKLASTNRILSNYAFKNGILTINNKIYQDSILLLNKKITILKNDLKVITSPPIIVYKNPIWIWFYIGFSILSIITLLIVIFKK